MNVQQTIVSLLLPPGMTKLYILYKCWGDPTKRAFNQLEQLCVRPLTSVRVLELFNPPLCDFVHEHFNRNRHELEYFWKKWWDEEEITRQKLEQEALDNLKKKNEQSKPLPEIIQLDIIDETVTTQIPEEEIDDSFDESVYTRDTFKLIVFSSWVQDDMNRVGWIYQFVVPTEAVIEFRDAVYRYSKKVPIFLKIDPYRYHFLYKEKLSYGTIESLLTEWCDIVAVNGMPPIPTIEECPWLLIWAKYLPRYVKVDELLNKGTTKSRKLFKGKK